MSSYSTIRHLATGCIESRQAKNCHSSFSDEVIAAYVETCGESLKELYHNCVCQ
ncbi:hypothetical protein P3S67_032473 [Capsicum chacoense]